MLQLSTRARLAVAALSFTACACDPDLPTEPAADAPGVDVIRPLPALPACTGDARDCAWFEEVSVELGLATTAESDPLGSGVALGDVNGDDRLDVVAAAVGHVHLWLQRADGGFDDVSGAWALDNILAEKAVVLVDWDGDGDLDLAATSYSPARDVWLARNDGDRFVDITVAAGLTSVTAVSSVAWADYDLDGDLDCYVARYNFFDGNTLWRNDGDSTFTDVTAAAGVANLERLAFQPLWFDMDDDGDPDLYVANDRATRPALFRNEGDGTFTDVSSVAGVDLAVEAMGIASDDLDGDGDLDLYVGNVPHLPVFSISNLLHLNDGTGVFPERGRLQGAALDRWTWATCSFDPDMDGDLDLFAAVQSWDTGLGNALLENTDGLGTFEDATYRAELTWVGSSYGAAVGDLNGDGAPDLVVTGRHGDPLLRVYRNRLAGTGGWIKVRLQGAVPNVFAIGARVSVETGAGIQVRELRAGEGLRGSNPPELLFGLGAETLARVTVRWPASGAITVLDDVPTGTIATVVAP